MMYIVPPQPPHRIHGNQRNARKGAGGGGMGDLLFSKEDSFHHFFDSGGEKRQRVYSKASSHPCPPFRVFR